MKAAIKFLLLLFFTNCKDSNIKTAAKKPASDTTTVAAAFNSIDTVQNQIDTTILHADTAVILGETYIGIYKTNDTFYVLNKRLEKILQVPELHPNFEFDDFNGDGLKDIRVHYLSNVPGIQELLLFDKKKRNFRLVKNFSDFPVPKAIMGTKLYYSYHRSGCADMNWGSDLFYLEDYKTVRIGNIAGYECENRDIKDGIYIQKINGKKEILLEKLPISTIQNYDDYKWGFIKAYWKKHYKRFM